MLQKAKASYVPARKLFGSGRRNMMVICIQNDG
jgi:hypothetical protein